MRRGEYSLAHHKTTGIFAHKVIMSDSRPNKFTFLVQDVFAIEGRGVATLGIVTQGAIRSGANVMVRRASGITMGPFVIGQIETVRKVHQEALMGENVSLLLQGCKRADVNRGDIVFAPSPDDAK